MNVTLKVFKDNTGFFYMGVYRTFVYEYLEVVKYEWISFYIGTYAENETHNVLLGQTVADGDTRGRRMLKILNKLDNEVFWTDKSIEEFVEIGLPPPPPPATTTVINNIYNGVPTTPYQWFAVADEQASTVIDNIGDSVDLIIEKAGIGLSEHLPGTDFDAGNLPVGKTYKIDKNTDTVYWGETWLATERLYIRSDKVLTIDPSIATTVYV